MEISVWWLLILFVALLLLRIPVAFALLAPTIFYSLVGGTLPPLSLPAVFVSGTGSFLLLTIPMFILMAEIMNRSKVTSYLFDFSQALVGHIRGSVAHVNVLSSLIFAGMSGSALADIAGLGRIQVQSMRMAGFSNEFAGALVVAASSLGPILPPSIIMVVYAAAAETSVGAMFLGGVVPALVLAFLIMGTVYLMSFKHEEWKSSPRKSWAECRRATLMAVPALLAPVILLGGFLSGLWTPTEAGAVAAIYVLLVAMLVYRSLHPAELGVIMSRTVLASANVLIIFAAAHVLSTIVALEGVPTQISGLLASLTDSPYVILLLINVVFIIGGMFLEPTPFLLVATPILVEISKTYHLNLIHVGVVCVTNLMLGNMTPPFAIGLFAVQEVTGAHFGKLVRASLPFYVTFFVMLALITYVPALVLALPNWILG